VKEATVNADNRHSHGQSHQRSGRSQQRKTISQEHAPRPGEIDQDLGEVEQRGQQQRDILASEQEQRPQLQRRSGAGE
jgi:hypothetical protein